MKKKNVVLIFVFMLLISSGCSTGGANEPQTGDALARYSFNILPEINAEGKDISIAIILVKNDALFWRDVSYGTDAVVELLRQKKYNCKVDVFTVKDYTGPLVKEKAEECIEKKYDAICMPGASNSLVDTINKASESGILVYLFNSDCDTSKRIAFFGQDLDAAGRIAGTRIAESMHNKGKVAVITGYYNVDAMERRRKGAESVFSASKDISYIGTYENHDSRDEAYDITKAILEDNPDLSGLLVTAGGCIGAADAILEAGLNDQITLAAYDFYKENVEYTRKGYIDILLDQDAFGQGSDPVIAAYNHVLAGKPQFTGIVYSRMDIATPENIVYFFPEN